MTISEKLTRLLELHNRHAVARAANIRPETLASLLKGERQPHLRTVRDVGRVLKVDFGWLTNDTQGWPPLRCEEAETAHAA